jgi:hypothetical protein
MMNRQSTRARAQARPQISRSTLRLLCLDFHDLVAAGLLQDTLRDAEGFVSGYLAYEGGRLKMGPDSLRLTVLPGLPGLDKDNA